VVIFVHSNWSFLFSFKLRFPLMPIHYV
jgi:hypothetical protein